jgi:hypothetical protein
MLARFVLSRTFDALASKHAIAETPGETPGETPETPEKPPLQQFTAKFRNDFRVM